MSIQNEPEGRPVNGRLVAPEPERCTASRGMKIMKTTIVLADFSNESSAAFTAARNQTGGGADWRGNTRRKRVRAVLTWKRRRADNPRREVAGARRPGAVKHRDDPKNLEISSVDSPPGPAAAHRYAFCAMFRTSPSITFFLNSQRSFATNHVSSEPYSEEMSVMPKGFLPPRKHRKCRSSL